MKKLLGVLIVLFSFGLLVACGGNEKPSTITQDEYNQLEKDMTIEKVKDIVGGEPTKINEIEKDWLVEYEYNGEDGVEENSSVSLLFKDNKLDTIIETGLVIKRTQITEEPNEESSESKALLNAESNPAKPGAKLFGEEFKGIDYYFKGELIGTKEVEGLFNNMENALLVKNSEGFVMVIFPAYEIEVNVGDEVEVEGPLSGDGYASSDLGVDNVVGVTGAINASQLKVNGEIK